MSDITVPKPTSSHFLWGGAVEIHCFGASHDWSLAGSSRLQADMNNPGIGYRMLCLAEKYACSQVYAPNPSEFNGRIALPDEFTIDWIDNRIVRGPFADGVLLTRPNTAFVVSSADCPTGVLRDPVSGAVVAAHAGLMSMYDRGKPSVAMEMNRVLWSHLGHKYSPMLCKSFIACGISPNAYFLDPTHPRFSRENMLICDQLLKHWNDATLDFGEGWLIDLPKLFRLQMEECCVAMSSVGFDGVCTYNDIGPIGKPMWHSNWRGDKTRNLVLVIRR